MKHFDVRCSTREAGSATQATQHDATHVAAASPVFDRKVTILFINKQIIDSLKSWAQFFIILKKCI